MRLEKIVLSGFKSFADKTVIPLKHQLNAVVGPNGCGKSNVVDAIRWVVGEISAKQLRGQSMADVIFNGSRQRSAMGKASVELVFDNSLGRMGGSLAKYNELSLRREVVREGQSRYYINGTVCRRKDIIDLFLGTGLGPRSYAIIEQGMISRLIDAKPDEMRIYFEEVAGISKYRERRRETENRIRHTRENMERVMDVRDELAKQLVRLKRQASAAERFKVLKEEEHQVKGEVHLLAWQKLQAKRESLQERRRQQETQQESQRASLEEQRTAHEKWRQQWHEAQDKQQLCQENYYALASEVARLEENIKGQENRRSEWLSELEHIEQMFADLNQHTDEQNNRLKELELQAEDLTPQSEECRLQAEQTRTDKQEAAQAMQAWQTQWQQWQRDVAAAKRELDQAQSKRDHLQSRVADRQERQARLENQLAQLQQEQDSGQGEALKNTWEEHKSQLTETEERLVIAKNDWANLKENVEHTQKNWQQARDQEQEIKSHCAALESVQETALKGDKMSQGWLKQRGLSQAPRLANVMEVQSGWELAAETVFHGLMDAVCVEGLQDCQAHLKEFKQGQLTLLSQEALKAETQSSLSLPKLEDKVTHKGHWFPAFSSVFVAESLEEAWAVRNELQAHESIITQDGIWLASNWLRMIKKHGSQGELLAREKKIKQLKQDIEQAAENSTVAETTLQQAKQAAKDKELQVEEMYQTQRQQQQAVNQSYAAHSSWQSKVKQQQNQSQSLQNDLQSCLSQLGQWQADLQDLQQNIPEKESLLSQSQEKMQQHENEKSGLQSRLNTTGEADEDQQRQLALLKQRQQNTTEQIELLRQTVSQSDKQKEQMLTKRAWLQEQLADDGSPLDEMKQKLQQQLEKSQALQNELSIARQSSQEWQDKVESTELQIQKLEKAVQLQTEQLQELQMKEQESQVRQQTLQETLLNEGHDFDKLREELPQEAVEDVWRQRLEQLSTKIQRLGAINLAAIEECEEITERKDHIDKQHADLEEALQMLEQAMQKIDKETRTQFKDTFEQVNLGLKHLFPKIFNGGTAYLELTENDYLTAGIVIKAQPPGKKNASIHMLSGGEKALTAIALVFSLFQLNPAPFCILDEVDAPLDDANVGRFCRLVREMSDQVQFIVISHNKVTIEMADSLMGVTMHEPGVSRIVSVDMQEAVSMVDE